MPDPIQDRRFYPEAKPVTADSVADLVKGELVRGDGKAKATEVATPDSARAGSICFVANAAAAAEIPKADGFICLTLPELTESIPGKGCVVATADPKGALGLVLRRMYPAEEVPSGVDPSAAVDPGAKLGDGVSVAAGAVIEAGAELGAGVSVGPGAVVGRGCVLGAGASVGANSVIGYAIIGEGTVIGPSVVIGNQGFGIGRDTGRGGENHPIPHLGRVVIGARSYVGAQCNIDRGFIKDTVIGDAVMIDAMVHIAHNVTVGDGCVLCGQVGIAGSVTLGRNNVLGSKAGIADNVTVGDGNMFAALTGVTKDVGSDGVMGGFPAVPMGEFRRQAVALRQLGRTGAKQGGENG